MNVDPEESVISALMVDQECISKIYGILSPEMFETSVYGSIYLQYCRAYDSSKTINLAELQEMLIADGIKEQEIEYYLNKALDSAITSAGVEGSAEVIQKRYKKSCVDMILSRTELKADRIEEEIDRLITDLESLKEGRTSKTKTISEIADEYKDTYFVDNDKPKANIGIRKLDDMIGGLEGGDLVICGARPATGKSALVTQWAWHFADMGMRVGFYNLEMTEKQVLERMIVAKSGIELVRLRMAKAYLNDEEARYKSALNELYKQNKIFLTTGAKKVSEIRSEMKHMNYDVLIVDYVQLLICDGKYSGNRVAEVGELSRQLKSIAMDFNIPVIGLSQLNRVSEGTSSKEPNMSQLREAGNLEQDASVILLMWNSNESDLSQKTLKVEKARNGKTGRVDLVFDGAHMTFKAAEDVSPFDGR